MKQQTGFLMTYYDFFGNPLSAWVTTTSDLQPGKTAQRPLDSDVSRPSVADSAVYPGISGTEVEQENGVQRRDSERD